MFDTLVESGSHSDDLARKGSFFLGTMVVYAVVMLAVIVVGIYLYNDSIPDPSLELLTLVAPAPMQAEEPKNEVGSGGVLNGKAISKPQPAYPPIAKAARAQGTVTVQILVDESGRVVSATAVSGHPLLQQAAVAAARQARFSPTLLSGQPVKVSGVITYNFVLQ